MEHKMARIIVRFRFPILIACLLFIGFCLGGIKYLGLKTNYRHYLAKQDLEALSYIYDTYIQSDTLMFVVAPKDQNVFTKETLSAIEWVTEKAWKMPYTQRVDSITNFQHTRVENDDLEVRDLVKNASTLSEKDIQNVKNVVMHDPRLLNSLVSPKGHVTSVVALVSLPQKSNTESPEVVAYARELRQQFKEKFPNIELRLTGIVMLSHAFQEAAQKDMSTFIPAMLIFLLLILGIMLRSINGVIATFASIIGGVLCLMGIMGWCGILFTTVSIVAPIIVLTVSVADCVHVLNAILLGMKQGLSKLNAIEESLKHNMRPCFLTFFTTIIGFMALNFNDSPPFRELGTIVAIGCTIVWVLTMFFLPTLVSVLPLRVKIEKEIAEHGDPMMRRFGKFIIRHQTSCLLATLAFFIVMCSFLPRLYLNEVFVEFFDQRIEFRRDTDFTAENLTGVYGVYFSLNSGNAGGVNNPEFLNKVDNFVSWLRAQKEVVHVQTVIDTIKDLNQKMNRNDSQFYKVPQTEKQAAQYLLMYQMSLPAGKDLTTFIDIDNKATRVVAYLKNMTGNEQLAFEERARQWLESRYPGILPFQGTSEALAFTRMAKRNTVSMLEGDVTTLIIIAITMMILFRSFSFGILSLIPNVLPILIAFGFWGLIHGMVGRAVAICFSMSLGIVVDDTIHFVAHYLKARRKLGLNPEAAIEATFASMGKALFVTTTVLLVGFGILACSPYSTNSEMGLLTSFTILFGAVYEVFMLAPLVLKLESYWQTKKEIQSSLEIKKAKKTLISLPPKIRAPIE